MDSPECRLSDPGRLEAEAQLRLPADLRSWLPGDAIWEGNVYAPDTLVPGGYRVRLALLDPRTGQPAVRDAIDRRENHGWYGLGALTGQWPSQHGGTRARWQHARPPLSPGAGSGGPLFVVRAAEPRS